MLDPARLVFLDETAVSTNMARLCRFHHRVKTHTPWTVHRITDEALVWTSPTGTQYLVDPTGTTLL